MIILDFFRRWRRSPLDENARIDLEIYTREQDQERAAAVQRMADSALWDLDFHRESAGFIAPDDPWTG